MIRLKKKEKSVHKNIDRRVTFHPVHNKATDFEN